jgi:hypothetical protein
VARISDFRDSVTGVSDWLGRAGPGRSGAGAADAAAVAASAARSEAGALASGYAARTQPGQVSRVSGARGGL